MTTAPSAGPARTIAIGDIHGCAPALATVLREIGPRADDTVIVLGDVIDRGPDSRGVIDRLLALGRACSLVTLLGNHEEMMFRAREDDLEMAAWLSFGGAETLASYGAEAVDELPAEHLAYLASCRDFFETAEHFFVHGNYLPGLPLADQPREVLRWESLWQRTPKRHCSGKTAIVGHTSQRGGEILDLGHLKCIDTFCYGGGWLTALEIATGQVWQADQTGKLRETA